MPALHRDGGKVIGDEIPELMFEAKGDLRIANILVGWGYRP
jgi:hypothetical protein